MSASAFELRRTAVTVADPEPVEPAATAVIATVQPAGVERRHPPLAASALTILATLLLGFAGYVGGIGHVVHARDQQLAYAELREQLANATAPTGQLSSTGSLLALGAPVALIEAPGLREVVLEGTTAEVLTSGPGHRRDTVLPGQPGTSVIMGRKAAFGGPFAALDDLRTGETVTVTTGQGVHRFTVVGVRRAGAPGPLPLAPGSSRLTLVTATGPTYLPSGVVRVDADLVSAVQPVAPRIPLAMGVAEQALRGDRSALLGVVLWGQALALAACLVTWLAARWGSRQAWVVGVPLLGALSLAVAHSAALLLPNLL